MYTFLDNMFKVLKVAANRNKKGILSGCPVYYREVDQNQGLIVSLE